MFFNRKFNLTVALALLAVAVLAYGLLIPWLGFYSDDWLFLWIGQKMGAPGLARYFTTNRPFWGLLYQASMPQIGSAPAGWHLRCSPAVPALAAYRRVNPAAAGKSDAFRQVRGQYACLP